MVRISDDEIKSLEEGELRTYQDDRNHTYYLYYPEGDEIIVDETYGLGYQVFFYDRDPASAEPVVVFEIYPEALFRQGNSNAIEKDLREIGRINLARLELANLTLPSYDVKSRWSFFSGDLYRECIIAKIFFASKGIPITRMYWNQEGFLEDWDDFAEAIKKTTTRFVVAVLTLTDQTNDAHANVVIADRTLREIERFDPIGWSRDYNVNDLDFLMRNNARGIGYNYITGTNFCPHDSFQTMQNNEEILEFGDPEGYCSAWSFFWIQMRLQYPEIGRAVLLKTLLEKIPRPLTKYIRSYSKWLIDQAYRYLFNLGIYNRSLYYHPDQDDLEDVSLGFPVVVTGSSGEPANIIAEPGSIYVYTYRQIYYFTHPSQISPGWIKYLPEDVLDDLCDEA